MVVIHVIHYYPKSLSVYILIESLNNRRIAYFNNSNTIVVIFVLLFSWQIFHLKNIDVYTFWWERVWESIYFVLSIVNYG